jgi:hypothetical protein
MNKFISIWFGGRIAKVFSAALMICSLSHCKGPKAEDVRTEPPAKYVPASSNSSDDKDDENEDGDASVVDDRGRSYEVHLDE